MPPDVAELPASLRRRGLSFYLVFFGIVLPFRSVAPLSWAFLIYAFRSGIRDWPDRILVALALSEAVFSIYHYQLLLRVSRLNPSNERNIVGIQAAFKRLLKTGLSALPPDGADEESLRPGSPDETITQLERDDPRAIDFRNTLRTWFWKASWSSLRLREMQTWIYWSIYNADMPPFEDLSTTQQTVINEALEQLQMRTGCKIPQGSNPSYPAIRLTIDPIKINCRPLTFYILVALVNRYLRGWFMVRYNVKYGSHKGLQYLIRIPKAWNNASGPRPVLFIHGLGFGLFQYYLFLRHLLNTTTDRPVLVLLQPQISQDLFHPQFLQPLNRRQTVERLVSLLAELGWVDSRLNRSSSESSTDNEEDVQCQLPSPPDKTSGVAVLSHSNGSYTHAWLLKDCPRIVTRSCFADPVTFCSWEGDVCYNFIYRTPTTGAELLMQYFVSTELGVANLLQRHFDWASNSLWYEEIPNARDPSKALFMLGGKDAIVNSERVIKYLRSHGVKKGIRYNPEGRHGQALVVGGQGHSEILGWLKEQ
ncbi:hypothetical protein AX15_007673 [Amanita polypyramis BW_CC]|nr:hypothetical protein AX15_007673 [Amanita polypyramis BW_CC]